MVMAPPCKSKLWRHASFILTSFQIFLSLHLLLLVGLRALELFGCFFSLLLFTFGSVWLTGEVSVSVDFLLLNIGKVNGSFLMQRSFSPFFQADDLGFHHPHSLTQFAHDFLQIPFTEHNSFCSARSLPPDIGQQLFCLASMEAIIL